MDYAGRYKSRRGESDETTIDIMVCVLFRDTWVESDKSNEKVNIMMHFRNLEISDMMHKDIFTHFHTAQLIKVFSNDCDSHGMQTTVSRQYPTKTKYSR